MPNRLAGQTSPYLLQHAGNPVDWHPWDAESLETARTQNKPIFLSIGYSACHWCHVMAHESFENADIAEVMNSNFVSIKVDREERPDIDDIYQKVCQMATGQGGWPLSVFLTPDQKPFYVGTYFPPMDSYGRKGFGSILRQLAQAWREKPGDIRQAAEKFVAGLEKIPAGSDSEITKSVLDEAAVNLLQMGDHTYGGFGSAPKFPNSAVISFMFRYYRLSGISKFRDFALKTLRRMACGGIFDQLGGGFHRYSTDARWLVPHFEKMLYDNALIPINYIEAYQITRDTFYLDILVRTLDYVLREMTSPEGGFYSALDADSEGEEGRYYVWSKRRIQEILGADADLFCLFYDVTDGGNWEGSTILCNTVPLSAAALQFGLSEREAKERLESAAKKLFDARCGRPRPGLDDKILTSWNALMVSALARGYRVTGQDRFLEAAVKCLEHIQSRMAPDGNLCRTYKDGRAAIPAYLEDYAYLACAILDVFELVPDVRYLQQAQEYGRHLVDHFWDEQTSGFFMTSDTHEQLIMRPKSEYDLSLPSGNSVAAGLLLRLYHLTQERRFADVATSALKRQAQTAAENPFGFGHLLNTIHSYLGPVEVTVLDGDNSDIARTASLAYLPESILVTVSSQEELDRLSEYPFFAGKKFGDAPSAYVCRNFSCSPPITSARELADTL